MTDWSEISIPGNKCCSCSTHTGSLHEATEATSLIRSNSHRTQTLDINFDRIWLTCLAFIMTIGFLCGFYLLYLEEQNVLPEETDIVSRMHWDAEPPLNNLTDLILPIEKIFIFQTNTNGCESKEECINQMKVIKQFHIKVLNEADILYNFVVAGDGRIYEGRGWEKISWEKSNNSLTVAMLGNFTTQPPLEKQSEALLSFLDYAVIGKKVVPCFQILMDHLSRRFLIDLAVRIKRHIAEQSQCISIR